MKRDRSCTRRRPPSASWDSTSRPPAPHLRAAPCSRWTLCSDRASSSRLQRFVKLSLLTILEKQQDPSGGPPTPLYGGDYRGQGDIELNVLAVHVPDHKLLILCRLNEISFLSGLPVEGADVGVCMSENLLQLVVLGLVDVDSQG